MPTDRNAVVAEWLDAHDRGDLAWEPAKTCRQGHPTGSLQAGQFCMQCVELGYFEQIGEPGSVPWVEWQAMAEDPHKNGMWHPEWRIARLPHEFADPAFYLPALEAFCDTARDGHGGPPARVVTRERSPYLFARSHYLCLIWRKKGCCYL